MEVSPSSDPLKPPNPKAKPQPGQFRPFIGPKISPGAAEPTKEKEEWKPRGVADLCGGLGSLGFKVMIPFLCTTQLSPHGALRVDAVGSIGLIGLSVGL